MTTYIKWVTSSADERGCDVRPIFAERHTADPAYVADIGRTKRFLERWSADPTFRALIANDPRGLAAKYGLEADPEEIRLLWDVELLAYHSEGMPVPLAVRRYEAFIREKLQFREVIRAASSPAEPRLSSWRRRQMFRAASELGLAKAHGIVHAPVAFELSKGCSVGCWFCGVAAPKLGDIFTYTPENARLWRDTLEVVRDILGPAAGYGFCYWATDPLDNPDYEQFLLDFHGILGVFPQTTTAIPLRDPDRIRKLLKLSHERGGMLDRFSILSLGLLDRVHAEFTPDELAFVELVTQNKGTIGDKAFAGRARTHDRSRAQAKRDGLDDRPAGTIACVSGFLFSLVDRTVQLVSPCSASERWPLGYRVYARGNFTNGRDLAALLMRMIDEMMPTSVGRDALMRFHQHLTYDEHSDAVRVSSRQTSQTFADVAGMREVARAVSDGDKSASDIALLLEDERGLSLAETFFLLNTLFSNGVLSDEPEPTTLER